MIRTHRLHCRLCGFGSRNALSKYRVMRHIAKVHGLPLGEAEEWTILDKQQEGDDSRSLIAREDHGRKLFRAAKGGEVAAIREAFDDLDPGKMFISQGVDWLQEQLSLVK